MLAFTERWNAESGWSHVDGASDVADAQLLLAFGPPAAPTSLWFEEVRSRWPSAHLVYSTTGGQMDSEGVSDGHVVVTGMAFEKSRVAVHRLDGAGVVPCEELGRALGTMVGQEPGLRHVLLFLDGLRINGAAFSAGIASTLPPGVTASGGLASDGLEFASTGVGLDGPPQAGAVIAVGLCGSALSIGTGSAGGWEPFGPERVVTRSIGAEVFELDGAPALEVYSRYLGDLASQLPGSALLFPLAMMASKSGPPLVRTILGIDFEIGSLRFAGDVPQGHRVRLMRSTNDQLLDGAATAARRAVAGLNGTEPGLMLCVSCIGRRALLKSRTGEEIDEVAQFGGQSLIAGYYSNGEIAPMPSEGTYAPMLQNQTMTVTAIGER